MLYTYRVEFETDSKMNKIVVSLPSLNYTADFGSTVEEALEHLQTLAQGFLEVLVEKGELIPHSDPPGEGVYLALKIRGKSLAA